MNNHQECHVDPLEKPVDRIALRNAMAAYLTVEGMGCPRCATRVRNGLLSLTGVIVADVFLEDRLAAVAFDPGKVSPGELVGAVAYAGNDGRHSYRAVPVQVKPLAEGMVFRGDQRYWF